MPVEYRKLQERLLQDYSGHGLGDVSTQYGQTGPVRFPGNEGSVGGTYVDQDEFPASACSDTATPHNCITDAQIQAEIKKVIALKRWKTGIDARFVLFTSSGEGSCDGPGSCAYTEFCGYHSFFGPTTNPVIYANMPFGNPDTCQSATSPNGDLVADSELSVASHEIAESITDPLINAWLTSMGNEIGDLCSGNFGANTWTSLTPDDANQMWNGNFYELQQEFDNHAPNSCAPAGPV